MRDHVGSVAHGVGMMGGGLLGCHEEGDWTYPDRTTWSDADITGFDVEATDGSIGKIDESSAAAGSAYIVVDTGFWIFGKKRLVPAGVVDQIDRANEKVFVRMTKEQVKDAPDFEETHRDRRGTEYDTYYDPFVR